MKCFIIVSAFLVLILNGCVNTYNLADYSNPDKFYKYLNSSSDDRSVIVQADSDITYQAEKLYAGPDTMSFNIRTAPELSYLKSFYTLSEISKTYTQTIPDNKTIRSLLLNNGDIISAKEMIARNDTIFIQNFAPEYSEVTKKIYVPTKNIDCISFNDRRNGIGEMALFSALGGAIYTAILFKHNSTNEENLSIAFPAFAGAVVFGLGGAVLGGVIGARQEFFINRKIENYKGLNSFQIEAGTTMSYLSMKANGLSTSSNYLYDFSTGILLLWSFDNYIGIKSGLLYKSIGGTFNQYIKDNDFTYTRDVFIKQLDVPLLLQYNFNRNLAAPRIYAGPQLNFFVSGRLDNIYDMQNNQVRSDLHAYYKNINSGDVNSPQISFVFGAGINIQKHITLDLIYETSLTNLSGSLYNSEVTGIKPSSLSMLIGYGF